MCQVAAFLVRLNLHEQGDDTWVNATFNGDGEWEIPSSWTREVTEFAPSVQRVA